MAKFLRVLENRARNARPSTERRAAFAADHLEVRMFNVGRGEAILVVFPNNRAWLVDGGSTNSQNRSDLLADRLLGYLGQEGLTLDALVLSHGHIDHAGAASPLLERQPRPSVLASPLTIYRSGDAWSPSPDGRPIWLKKLADAIDGAGQTVEVVALRDQHRAIPISDGVEAHLFAGSSDGPYTSILVQLRYRQARLLFTGDTHCDYEMEVLDMIGQQHFRADVLKVTHHGSSSGTAATGISAIRPGIALASTADHGGHTLEADTLARLGGRPGPDRRIYETVVDGDIILRTDGGEYRGGVLYQVECERPGRFAVDLEADHLLSLDEVDAKRAATNDPDCL